MYTHDRSEATGHLDEAWRRAAINDMERAGQHIGKALDLLEAGTAHGQQSALVERMVHRHVEEGRAAIAESDVLGALLATVAALDVLGTELQAHMQRLDKPDGARSMGDLYAI